MNNPVDACPLCGCQHHEPFEAHKDAGYTLTYQICSNCGLVFQSPCMDEDALAAFYASGYRRFVQGTEEPTEKDLRIQGGRARHQLQLARRIIPAVSRHLDIGSSSGALLRVFRSYYGCESVGIEPGEAYRTQGYTDGIQVYAQLADMDLEKQGSFDLVTMSHVLEHISDPGAYLVQIRERWMTPDGYLLVEVPNLFGHYSVELSHLVLFSPNTLRLLLSLSGFEVLRLFTHGNPRSPILNLYITIIARARADDQSVSATRISSRGVRTRRAIGMWRKKSLSRWFPRWTWKPLPELEEDT